jgi:hypothetical protein
LRERLFGAVQRISLQADGSSNSLILLAFAPIVKWESHGTDYALAWSIGTGISLRTDSNYGKELTMKTARIVLMCSVLLSLCSTAFAAEYWVIREKSGKCDIVKRRPADSSLIFKGPFDARKKAEVALKECRRRVGAAVEYWVVLRPSGALVIVDRKPSDTAVIVKGPFRERKKAEVLISESPRRGAAKPSEQPKMAPRRAPKEGTTLERKQMEQLKFTPERGLKERAVPEAKPAERPTSVPGTSQGPESPGSAGREQDRERK